jgi:ribosomal protein S3
MGQKVNAHLIRVGPVFGWESRWFAAKGYKDILLADYTIRKSLMEKLRYAGVSRIEIDRSINSVKLTAFVSKPGMVIGRSGAGLEELKKFIEKLMLTVAKDKKHMPKLDIAVEPIKEPNLDAYLVAKNECLDKHQRELWELEQKAYVSFYLVELVEQKLEDERKFKKGLYHFQPSEQISTMQVRHH